MATENLRYNTLIFKQPASMSNNSSLKNSRNNRNNNNKRMNELLNKIGTDSKSLFNKMTFKKSKSAEFLDIVERKISEIKLADIQKDSINIIQKKIEKLEKIFIKLKDFFTKIQSKNNTELKNRVVGIYRNNFNIFAAFSFQIKLNVSNNLYKFDIKDLKKLEEFIGKLIELNNLLYFYDNEKSKILKSIEENKRFISERIIYLEKIQERLLQESAQSKITNLIIEFNKLKNNLTPVKNRGIRTINNSEKQDLSRHIIDLATKIYEQAKKTQDINDFNQLKQMLAYLHDIYTFIFIESQINRNKNQTIGSFNGPYSNTYKNLERKYQELNKKLNQSKIQNATTVAYTSSRMTNRTNLGY